MEKLNMQTTNMVDENIKRIGELFPNCLTERLNEEGKPEVAIDFDQLRQELSKDIVEGPEERYQFTWPDKRNAIRLANVPTTDTLRPCREESVDFDNTKNLYIEGDNLEVLKLLRQNYLGKVKMIYIDPPYNTGNDFVYNDEFDQDSEYYKHNSGQFDELGNRLVTNTESNGRFHTDWLNMIYPRLKVVKDLLSEDGVIFISIDDNEVNNLKKVCNEIFGERNFLACFKWNRVAKAPSLSGMVRTKYEYVLTYFRTIQPKLFGKASYNTQGPLWHLPNKRAELTFPAKSIRVSQSFEAKDYGGTYEVELLDNLIEENGLNRDAVRIRACSAWGQTKISEYIRSGKTFQIKKSPTTMYTDLDSEDNFIAPSDLINDDECGVKRNTDAKDELRKMNIPFDYSKPVSLPQYLAKTITYNSNDAIILDFFSGSATTAHAVMQLNAEDGGKRKFIMVQLPEPTDEDSEAYKAGYKNICEIGKERIRRAGKKIKEDSPLTTKHLDTGFRVLKLDSSNMNDVFYTPEAFTERDLFEDNIKGDRTDEDLLFQTMIELGIELSAKIEKKSIAGKTVWSVSDGYLMSCFDKDVNETAIKEIAKMKPFYFVMRDASLATDNVADNFEQIWSEYSKDTVRRIL